MMFGIGINGMANLHEAAEIPLELLDSVSIAGEQSNAERVEETPEDERLTARQQRQLELRRNRGKVNLKPFTQSEIENDSHQIQVGADFQSLEEDDDVALNVEEDYQLPPIKSFEAVQLDKTLKENIHKVYGKGYAPVITKVQANVIPYIMHGDGDIVVRSRTGSGKTGAYIIPLIDLILKEKMALDPTVRHKRNTDMPYAVVFAPTRELAMQIALEATKLAERTEVRVAWAIGESSYAASMEVFRNGVDILVGTPGRLNHDFYGSYNNNYRKQFQIMNLKYIVLDEADRLTHANDFYQQITAFKESLENMHHRTFLLSATECNDHFNSDFVNDPVIIHVGKEDNIPKNIIQSFIQILPQNPPLKTKRTILVNLLKILKEKAGANKLRVIIFVRQKRTSDALAIYLMQKKYSVNAMNGDRPMKCRIETMRKIREGEIEIVVATDVLARGVNVPNVDVVINYELPVMFSHYIHRIGRTGRMGNSGRVVTFFDAEDGYNSEMAFFFIKCLESVGQKVPQFLIDASESRINAFCINAKNFVISSDETYIPPIREAANIPDGMVFC